MNTHDRLVLSLSTALLVALKWYPWYVSSLYHGGHSHLTLTCYLLALAAVVFVFGMIFTKWRLGIILVKLCWWTVLISNVYYPIKLHTVGEGAFPMPVKAGIGVLLFGVGIALALRGSADNWLIAGMATFAGVVIYLASPLLILPLLEQGAEGSVFAAAPVASPASATTNRLIIVLDETSPEYSTQLVRAFESQPHVHVAAATVLAAGPNTLDAIPSMLSTRLYQGLAPCGATVACNTTQSIDFSRLRASDATTDIVGMYHPYCAMTGLRSCMRSTMFGPLSARQMFCFDPFRAGLKGRLVFCASDENAFRADSADLIAAAWAAPFWRDGGT